MFAFYTHSIYYYTRFHFHPICIILCLCVFSLVVNMVILFNAFVCILYSLVIIVDLYVNVPWYCEFESRCLRFTIYFSYYYMRFCYHSRCVLLCLCLCSHAVIISISFNVFVFSWCVYLCHYIPVVFVD